ncbi:porin [Brucella oryzae]|uniref:Porin n=1 Tax=Brucella oryzae TaxID=335286 RepID=A0A2S7IXN4_9HYPH|nr:porin [Brucella oryzae]MBR7651029.1 porin [Brucella oryzae]PQA72762.1 porin [Brucella oryzae]
MKLKNILCGCAATLVSISSAYAADAVIAPEPEAVEYVRVCDAYGAGYFYIPGTETCLRISGYVRYDAAGGDNVYGRGFYRSVDGAFASDVDGNKTWRKLARFTLRLSTASETELGTLTTFAETRYDWADGYEGASGALRFAYIQLGGLRVGLDESAFVTFPGKLGNVINDDVILAGGYRTGLISYTFTSGNGFSAILSLEQGNNVDTDSRYGYYGTIDDYTPHVVGGLRFAQGWGALTAVAAYDSLNEGWAGKIRADVNVTDRFSLWVMGGYKNIDDEYIRVVGNDGTVIGGIRAINSFYGTWGGDWAVWGGASFRASQKATFNLQAAYDGTSTFAATANVAYEVVSGFTVTPEVSYTKWSDEKSVLDGKDAWQGMVRFQRSF